MSKKSIDTGSASGQKQGRRLSKCGPALGRALLFNCARAATRMKVWRPYYQAQLAKGLSTTAATVILARKMVRGPSPFTNKTGRSIRPGSESRLDNNHRISFVRGLLLTKHSDAHQPGVGTPMDLSRACARVARA